MKNFLSSCTKVMKCVCPKDTDDLATSCSDRQTDSANTIYFYRYLISLNIVITLYSNPWPLDYKNTALQTELSVQLHTRLVVNPCCKLMVIWLTWIFPARQGRTWEFHRVSADPPLPTQSVTTQTAGQSPLLWQSSSKTETTKNLCHFMLRDGWFLKVKLHSADKS